MFRRLIGRQGGTVQVDSTFLTRSTTKGALHLKVTFYLSYITLNID
jgi:hypothetical protein